MITSDRPYKRALSQLEAVRRIRQDEGSHFDPAVVAAFMRVVDAGRLEDLRRFAPPSHLVEVGAGEEARVGFAWG